MPNDMPFPLTTAQPVARRFPIRDLTGHESHFPALVAMLGVSAPWIENIAVGHPITRQEIAMLQVIAEIAVGHSALLVDAQTPLGASCRQALEQITLFRELADPPEAFDLYDRSATEERTLAPATTTDPNQFNMGF